MESRTNPNSRHVCQKSACFLRRINLRDQQLFKLPLEGLLLPVMFNLVEQAAPAPIRTAIRPLTNLAIHRNLSIGNEICDRSARTIAVQRKAP